MGKWYRGIYVSRFAVWRGNGGVGLTVFLCRICMFWAALYMGF